MRPPSQHPLLSPTPSRTRYSGRLLHPLALLLLLVLPTRPPAQAAPATAPLPPTELPGLRDSRPFFPGIRHRPSIPDPEILLGFPTAERAASSAEIERCLRAWTNAAPDRTRLIEYARSHEGRPLHLLILSSPAHIARLDTLQNDLALLADPRRISEPDAAALIERTPGVAWLAYTIHGDETEGSDAALAVIHHLLAAEDPSVSKLLDQLVIVIDPLMNPDGRDRFLKMIGEHRGTTPSVDEQSLLHSGYWPWGRGNHYLFDLNRDWLFARHPETRGRIREVSRWLPILFVDAHGMGAQDTHLFSPPREPINPNIPAHRRSWSDRFAADQAAAFDRHGLVYYSGEWNEEWYPGYSDGWASYRGAIGVLYEQARIAADGVRRPEGRILSYRESVFHHVLGSMANLQTTATHAKSLLAGLHATRREALDPAGRYGRRTFAIPPSANAARFHDLASLLLLQGFEIHTNAAPLTLPVATNQLGLTVENLTLPAGSLLIPNRQPLAHLLSAFLEFDTRMPERAVEEERRELLRTGETRIYDVTSWNLTMMYGLPAFTVPSDLPEGTGPYTPPAPPTASAPTPTPPVAWIFQGADDRSLPAAARLLERGVQVRVAEKPFTLDGQPFDRGSIVVTRLDNRTFRGDLAGALDTTSRELALPAIPVTTGLGHGEQPDLGGGHFRRLETPRIATLARDGTSTTDYGSIWFAIDHSLAVRHTQLDAARGADLARYNVLILPEGSAQDLGFLAGPVKEWVRSGGTLIAIGSATSPLLGEKADLSKVRPLSEVLSHLPDYELAVLREWHGRTGPLPDASQIWTHTPPTRLDYPWQVVEGGHPDEKELKRRDAWQSIFMPEGALFATRTDTNHWLTAGCPEPLPVLAGRTPVLMAAEGVEAPIRFGFLTPQPPTPTPPTNAPAAASTATNAPATSTAGTPTPDAAQASAPKATEASPAPEDAKSKDSQKPARVGWAALPPSTRMDLRMSGLVWPEATHRIANSAWVTRESLGRGQIILFASPPTFRGAAHGTTRVFLNAVVLGPGLGTRTPIRP